MTDGTLNGTKERAEVRFKSKEADGAKMPLFIYEPDDSKAYVPTRKVWLLAMVLFGVCAALWVAGTMMSQQILILICLTLAILGGATLGWMYRRIRKATQPLDEQEIDEKVEQYKIDLVDTFNGYDVPYTADDILDAADAYRERLMQEHASITDIDPSNIASLLRSMLHIKKKDKAKSKKAKRKAKGKEDGPVFDPERAKKRAKKGTRRG